MYGTNREQPDKNEKSWGYGLTIFSVGWIEDEQQNPFSLVCFQRTSLKTMNKIYEEDLFLSKYMKYSFSAGTLERTAY